MHTDTKASTLARLISDSNSNARPASLPVDGENNNIAANTRSETTLTRARAGTAWHSDTASPEQRNRSSSATASIASTAKPASPVSPSRSFSPRAPQGLPATTHERQQDREAAEPVWLQDMKMWMGIGGREESDESHMVSMPEVHSAESPWNLLHAAGRALEAISIPGMHSPAERTIDDSAPETNRTECTAAHLKPDLATEALSGAIVPPLNLSTVRSARASRPTLSPAGICAMDHSKDRTSPEPVTKSVNSGVDPNAGMLTSVPNNARSRERMLTRMRALHLMGATDTLQRSPFDVSVAKLCDDDSTALFQFSRSNDRDPYVHGAYGRTRSLEQRSPSPPKRTPVPGTEYYPNFSGEEIYVDASPSETRIGRNKFVRQGVAIPVEMEISGRTRSAVNAALEAELYVANDVAALPTPRGQDHRSHALIGNLLSAQHTGGKQKDVHLFGAADGQDLENSRKMRIDLETKVRSLIATREAQAMQKKFDVQVAEVQGAKVSANKKLAVSVKTSVEPIAMNAHLTNSFNPKKNPRGFTVVDRGRNVSSTMAELNHAANAILKHSYESSRNLLTVVEDDDFLDRSAS
jgi:hypothetical protein